VIEAAKLAKGGEFGIWNLEWVLGIEVLGIGVKGLLSWSVDT
jgi:hypothetical protein